MRRKEYILFSDKLNEDLNIAICSNIHFDENMKREYTNRYGSGEYHYALTHKILRQLRAIKPTHIVIPGDLFNSSISSLGYMPSCNPGSCVLYFLQRANEIAPVYYTPGNTDEFFDKLLPISFGISSKGLLDIYNKAWEPKRTKSSYSDGSRIAFSGLSLPNQFYMLSKKEKLIFLLEKYKEKLKELSKFVDEHSFHVLLCHDPIIKEALISLGLDFDLVISSTTTHPKWLQKYLMNKGYDPELLYPEYSVGSYDLGQGKLIVSEGITRYHSNFGKLQSLEHFHNGTIENVRVLKRKNNVF